MSWVGSLSESPLAENVSGLVPPGLRCGLQCVCEPLGGSRSCSSQLTGFLLWAVEDIERVAPGGLFAGFMLAVGMEYGEHGFLNKKDLRVSLAALIPRSVALCTPLCLPWSQFSPLSVEGINSCLEH